MRSTAELGLHVWDYVGRDAPFNVAECPEHLSVDQVQGLVNRAAKVTSHLMRSIFRLIERKARSTKLASYNAHGLFKHKLEGENHFSFIFLVQ